MLGDGTEMSIWFCKNLGDAMLAFQGVGRVEEAFQSAYANADCPDDAAVFLRHGAFIVKPRSTSLLHRLISHKRLGLSHASNPRKMA